MKQVSLNIPLMQAHIQQLKDLDDLIAQHQQHGGATAEFMISQYLHRKEQLLKELVAELVAHNFENRLHEKMHLLRGLLIRFLSPDQLASRDQPERDELSELEALLA